MLKVDFYVEDKNLLIEADGTQHTDTANPWYSTYYASCDAAKDSFAHSKEISIIRIPYTKNVTESYITQYIKDFI